MRRITLAVSSGPASPASAGLTTLLLETLSDGGDAGEEEGEIDSRNTLCYLSCYVIFISRKSNFQNE